MITDDEMADKFGDWLAELDINDWVELMDKYLERQKRTDLKPFENADEYLAYYFADTVVPNLNADNSDRLYEEWRDAQDENSSKM